MIKPIFAFLLFCLTLNAYEIEDKTDYFKVKIKERSFENLYLNLKDEIAYNSYILVYELNLGKSTASVAKALDKKAVVKNGINLLLCKNSFTLKMHEENIDNMTFCPMIISIYQDETSKYISFKKYHPLKKGDKIASEINKRLKELILNSLK